MITDKPVYLPSKPSQHSDAYTKLHPDKEEIRMLVLKAASNGKDPVQCSLETVSLFPKPAVKYETISYV